MNLTWDKSVEIKFNEMVEKVPVFLRDMAKDKVGKRAESYALEAQRSEVTEQDLVNAFFKETPFGFHGPMKSDMEALGIDYTKYGHGK